MGEWIPFEEGKYSVEQAFLVAPNDSAVVMENPYIKISMGRMGKKRLQGVCQIRNILVIELLEDSDDLDVILDLGGEFKYYLKAPEIQGGKVFAPDVKSSFRFIPGNPWQKLSVDEFDRRLSRMSIISD